MERRIRRSPPPAPAAPRRFRGGADGGVESDGFGRIYLYGRRSLDHCGRPAACVAGEFHQLPQPSTVQPSGWIDTSLGGPNGTGSSVGISWRADRKRQRYAGEAALKEARLEDGPGGVLPVGDPYAGVAVPASVKLISPSSTTSGISSWRKRPTEEQVPDGCPDPSNNCMEFAPGYYPAGITTDGWHTYTLSSRRLLHGWLVKCQRQLDPADGDSMQPHLQRHFQHECATDRWTDVLLPGRIDQHLRLLGLLQLRLPVPSTALTCDGSAPLAA